MNNGLLSGSVTYQAGYSDLRVGNSYAPASNYLFGSVGMEIAGNNNTNGGMNLILSNDNPGTNAFVDLYLQNNEQNYTGSNFAVLNYNSSNYNNPNAYGTSINVANQLSLYGTLGPTLIGAFASGQYVNFVIGGSSTSNEVARFTANAQQFNNVLNVNNAVSVSSNAGTCSSAYKLNTFTNSSAATMAITLTTSTPTPTDGQQMIVRVYDFSAVAQTIGWTNTENSTVSAPLSSNGSTTLPLTVGFMYNGQTSKWRCIAWS